MSQKKRSLLNLTKLEFDIYFNKQLISIVYDDQTTVGDVLEQISQIMRLKTSEISLYLAKKSGDPKLAFPALERSRELTKTNEKRFVVVENKKEIVKTIPEEKENLCTIGKQKKVTLFSRLFGLKAASK